MPTDQKVTASKPFGRAQLEASLPPTAIAYHEAAETRRNPRSDENLDDNCDDSCCPSDAFTNIYGRSCLVTVART